MNPEILVVDDSLTVRVHLVQVLEMAGLRVTTCATAAEARQALARESYGLVILDVVLPDGDGIDILREIRTTQTTALTPVMLLSTEAEVHDRIRGMETGADEYLGKPYDASYVVARARELLRRGQAPESSAQATILVIDDSLTLREELRSVLEAASYRVLTAGTGEEGLRVAVTARPSLIVVDGGLPGIDGTMVVRRIRLDAALQQIPCLLLTASEEPAMEIRALDAGADAFVRKEEGMAVIQARVAALLRSAAGRPGDEDTASLLGPKRILAVEAAPAHLQGLATSLRGEGYEVAAAHSGEEALALLGVQPVDCILLDWLTPGLGALETCRRIKTAPGLRDIPLVIFAPIEDHRVALQALEAGADDYVSHATDIEVLQARIRAQIRRKQSEDVNRRVRERILRSQLEASMEAAARAKSEERLRVAQEALVRGERLRALGQMAAGIGHDLRNILNPLALRLELVKRAVSRQTPEKAMESLVEMDNLIRRGVETIERLREFGRQAPVRVEPTQLNRVVHEAAEIAKARLASGRGGHVVVREDLGDPPEIPAAAGELVSSFVNLIVNAIDAMPEGGQVILQTGAERGGAWVQVSDSGPGIPPEIKERLFEPFLTTKGDRGTGLGLAMVYASVQRHRGTISVESAPGKGTRFHLWFPAGRR